MIKKAGAFIAGFITGIVGLYAWGHIFDTSVNNLPIPTSELHSDADVTRVQDDKVVGSTNNRLQDGNVRATTTQAELIDNEAIIISDQKAGSSVTVGSVKLDADTRGGWVVIHEVKNGIIANALGAVRRDSGVYSDVVVKLLRATVAGGSYAVVLYGDNGDRQFNIGVDTPLQNAQGEYIMSAFNAK